VQAPFQKILGAHATIQEGLGRRVTGAEPKQLHDACQVIHALHNGGLVPPAIMITVLDIRVFWPRILDSTYSLHTEHFTGGSLSCLSFFLGAQHVKGQGSLASGWYWWIEQQPGQRM
jgi:hypothetical protein